MFSCTVVLIVQVWWLTEGVCVLKYQLLLYIYIMSNAMRNTTVTAAVWQIYVR